MKNSRVLQDLTHTGSAVIRALCFTRVQGNLVRYLEADTLSQSNNIEENSKVQVIVNTFGFKIWR